MTTTDWNASAQKASGSHVSCKRHSQQRSHSLRLLTIKTVESITESLKVGFCGVRAEKPVPKGKDVSIVRVGLPLLTRVMHLVHMRRDNQQSQHAIQRTVQLDVGVLQLRVQAGENQINNNHPERETDYQDGRQLPKYSPDGFSRMLAKSSRHINCSFGVMDAMELPPQPGFMEHDVRHIGEKIQRRNSHNQERPW